MKRNLSVLLAFLCGLMALMGLAAWAETAQPLPTPFPEVRYQQMSAKSPFAIASADAAATAAPTPGFAAQLYVDGAAHVGNTDYVAIKTRSPEEGKPAVFLAQVGETTADGIKIERLIWSQEMGKTTVEISKNGEKATLAFDEDAIKNAQPPPGQPGMRLPMMVGQQVRGGNFGGPFQQPGALFNRIRAAPGQPTNIVPQPNVAGPGNVIRRRVIMSGQ